jgi:hypothetical protein
LANFKDKKKTKEFEPVGDKPTIVPVTQPKVEKDIIEVKQINPEESLPEQNVKVSPVVSDTSI